MLPTPKAVRNQGFPFLKSSYPSPGKHIKAALFKLGHTASPDPLNLLTCLQESRVSSVADPRGHPTSTFLFETCSTSSVSLSSGPDIHTTFGWKSLALPTTLNTKAAESHLFKICFQFLRIKAWVAFFFLLQKQYMLVIKIFKQCR